MEYQMLKSILLTPQCLEECLASPIRDCIRECAFQLKQRHIKRLIFTGCGTSYMIAQAALYFFKDIAHMECCCQSAFELLHYPSITIQEHDAIVCLSHTGGTKAVRDVASKWQTNHIYTIALTEVKDSPLEKVCDYTIIGPQGKDKATPKTRSFSSGLMVILLLASEYGYLNDHDFHWEDIDNLPKQVQSVIDEIEEPIKQLSQKWHCYSHYIVVGSGTNAITAKEGSLKLLETANVCALHSSIEEIAHGNELYLDKNYCTFLLLPTECLGKERFMQILEGTLFTQAHVCVITNDDSFPYREDCDIIRITSQTSELLSIFLMILPLQFFAYHLAILLGKNPDESTMIHEHMRLAIEKFHPPGYH